MVEPVIHTLVISWVSIVMQYTWTWDIQFSKIKSSVLCLVSNPHYCHHSRQVSSPFSTLSKNPQQCSALGLAFKVLHSWGSHLLKAPKQRLGSTMMFLLHEELGTPPIKSSLPNLGFLSRDNSKTWSKSGTKSTDHHKSHMFNIQVCHSDLTLWSICT